MVSVAETFIGLLLSYEFNKDDKREDIQEQLKRIKNTISEFDNERAQKFVDMYLKYEHRDYDDDEEFV